MSSTGLSLAEPLLGGAPAAGAKLQAVAGFVDREGGSFYQEWSALFVMQGSQGEDLLSLSTVAGDERRRGRDGCRSTERTRTAVSRILLKGQFLALPVTDPLDGERVVCYRSFLPATNALV